MVVPIDLMHLQSCAADYQKPYVAYAMVLDTWMIKNIAEKCGHAASAAQLAAPALKSCQAAHGMANRLYG